MSTFEIEGGVPLRGTVRASGNKNAILPIIAACILTDQEMVLDNVPDIIDVRHMLELIVEIGGRVERSGERVSIQVASIHSSEVSRALCNKVRTSILCVAPLLHRLGKARVYPPGGDVIGRRRLDRFGMRSRVSVSRECVAGSRRRIDRRGAQCVDVNRRRICGRNNGGRLGRLYCGALQRSMVGQNPRRFSVWNPARRIVSKAGRRSAPVIRARFHLFDCYGLAGCAAQMKIIKFGNKRARRIVCRLCDLRSIRRCFGRIAFDWRRLDRVDWRGLVFKVTRARRGLIECRPTM